MYFGANLFFLLSFPIWILLSINRSMRYAILKTFLKWYLYFLSRVYIPLLGVYKIKEDSGFEPVREGKQFIIATNHRSRIDGPVLLSVLRKTGVVMKASYAKFPVFSAFVKYLDFISVDPRSTESLNVAVNRCNDLIARKYNILIFPEGTRARTARLQTFKDLAFRLSIENNIPVLPVIVHTDHPFMAKIPGSIIPPETMKMVIRALSPMIPDKNERPAEFAARVRKRMAEELKLLDADTAWEKYQ